MMMHPPRQMSLRRGEPREITRGGSSSFLTVENVHITLWKRTGRSRQPYYFQMKDESPFAFAGIWDKWQRDGVSITSCAIITTTPNELLATIHDRMPAILDTEAQERWLRGDARPAELKEMLAPFPGSEMKRFPVSSRVNRPQVDGSQLIEPIDISQELTSGMLF